MPSLDIFAFGGLTLHYDGQPATGFASRKMEALLLYLAYTRHLHAREHLATLFWTDMPAEQGLGNLRVMLTRLRKMFPDLLLTSRQTVGFMTEHLVWCDAETLRNTTTSLMAQWRHTSRLVPNEITRIERALDLYRGPFLSGLVLNEAEAFHEWMEVEQDALLNSASQLCTMLAAYYEQQRDFERAVRTWQRLLQIDPLEEQAHRQVMFNLWQSGQTGRALEQYSTLRELLQKSLSVEPAAETRTLWEHIQANTPPSTPPRSMRVRLPQESSAFIGRQRELTAIYELISDAHCRLLTLYGIGGTGKTRLAIAAAQTLGTSASRFPDGVYFVAFESVTNPAAVIPAIISAMRLNDYQLETLVQLKRYLAAKTLLLICDNLEHLPEAGEILADLLDSAPQLKIIATSRERLQVREEWVYDVGGLDIPQTVEHLEACESVQLLLAAARQVGARVSLGRDGADIMALCKLVDGLPLALELSAPLLRELSLTTLLGRLRASLDTLASPLRNIPERQRSLGVLFDYVWERLSAAERQTLATCGVFSGTLSFESALSVAGLTEALREQLVSKGLLHIRGANRLHMHPLLRQYAHEQLAAQPQALHKAEARYAQYFVHFLQTRGDSLFTVDFRLALHDIETDLDNLRAVWQWSLRHGETQTVETLLHPLAQWFSLMEYGEQGYQLFTQALADHDWPGRVRGWLLNYQIYFAHVTRHYHWAEPLFPQAISAFAEQPDERGMAFLLTRLAWHQHEHIQNTADALLSIERAQVFADRAEDADLKARTLITQAMLVMIQGHFEKSYEILQQAHRCGSEHPLVIADIFHQLGMIEFRRDQYETAVTYFEQALEFDRRCQFDAHYARVLVIYGTSLTTLRRYDEAQQALGQALQFYRTIGHTLLIASTTSQFADLTMYLGRIDEARQMYESAAAMYRQAGVLRGAAQVMGNFAITCLTLNTHLPEARDALVEVVSLLRDLNLVQDLSQRLSSLGSVMMRLEDWSAAREYELESASLSLQVGRLSVTAEALYALALCLQQSGSLAQCAELLDAVLSAQVTTSEIRELAEKTRSTLPAFQNTTEDEVIAGILTAFREAASI